MSMLNCLFTTKLTHRVTDTHLTASFSEQPEQDGNRKVKLFWILIKQEMMWWK